MTEKPILNLAQRQFLADLMKSELFDDILKGLAEYHRKNVLPMIVSAHMVQNTQAAAVNSGVLDTLERLPDFFNSLADSQPASNT